MITNYSKKCLKFIDKQLLIDKKLPEDLWVSINLDRWTSIIDNYSPDTSYRIIKKEIIPKKNDKSVPLLLQLNKDMTEKEIKYFQSNYKINKFKSPNANIYPKHLYKLLYENYFISLPFQYYTETRSLQYYYLKTQQHNVHIFGYDDSNILRFCEVLDFFGNICTPSSDCLITILKTPFKKSNRS